MNESWNNKYNSELTTIKNKSFTKGWIIGFIAGSAVVTLLFMIIK